MKGNQVRAGRVLLVYRPIAGGEERSATKSTVGSKSNKKKSLASKAAAKNEAARVVHHKVKKGETLYSIASTYNTTVQALRRDNGKLASVIHPGDVLVIREH